MAQQASPPILLRGGLNLVTPAIAMPPGMVIAVENYESDVAGYARAYGYERYNGKQRPSDASYWVLPFDQGTAAITAGQTVTGLTSAAAAVTLLDAVITSGSYVGGDAAGYLVLIETSGFIDNEQLQVGGVTKVISAGTTLEHGADTADLDDTYTTAAADRVRTLVAAPAGAGNVLGGFVLNGFSYCFRDNGGVGVLYKAVSGAGWVVQQLGFYLLFKQGTVAFAEGETVTGGTSGHTGVIQRVVLLSGSYGAGTAAGLLAFASTSGIFSNGENLTGSIAGAAKADQTRVTNTLTAAGRYQATVHNFFGAGKIERAYVANGVDRGFEYDDVAQIMIPCFTGLTAALDKPTRVAQFAEHLWFGYSTGYGIHSEIGNPLQYSAVGDAGDFNIGHAFSDFIEASQTSLMILSPGKVGYVTGKDNDTFELLWITEDSGAEPFTAQKVNSPLFLDNLGIRRLSATQEFGNWRMGSMSQSIEPVFKYKQNNLITPRCSVRVRARDQYRIFYSDGSVVSLYVGRKNPECMLLAYPDVFTSAWVGTLAGESRETMFVGTTSGYVMELDRGRSFDGQDVVAYLKFAWNNLGSPNQNKRFHSVRLELNTDSAPAPQASLQVCCDTEYGNPDFVPSAEDLAVALGGGLWNAASWNQFYWSTRTVGQAFSNFDGFGTNVSVGIISAPTSDQLSHTLSSMTINYSFRGMRRGA